MLTHLKKLITVVGMEVDTAKINKDGHFTSSFETLDRRDFLKT